MIIKNLFIVFILFVISFLILYPEPALANCWGVDAIRLGGQCTEKIQCQKACESYGCVNGIERWVWVGEEQCEPFYVNKYCRGWDEDCTCGDRPEGCGGPAPTATPKGHLVGRVWNDVNCNGTADEIGNSSSDPDMIQNPANTCGTNYTDLAATISYSGVQSGSTQPNLCNPGPYYEALGIPVGDYTVSVNSPSGWQATNSPQSIAISNGQFTHVWLGVCQPPVCTPTPTRTPTPTLTPTRTPTPTLFVPPKPSPTRSFPYPTRTLY